MSDETTPDREPLDARGRTSACLPFCQGGLHEQGCPLLTAPTDACTHRWHDGRDPGPCPGCGYLRPQDAGGMEALARWLHNAGDGGCWEHFDLDSSRIVAAGLITSDWLASREAAAATRARAEALREAADLLAPTKLSAWWVPAQWLRARADSLTPDTAGDSDV